MTPRLLHDSALTTPEAEAALQAAQARGVLVEDTTAWTQEERARVYYDELVGLSSLRGKPLRGIVRTHKAGHIAFYTPVLITADDFFAGSEALEHLASLPLRTS